MAKHLGNVQGLDTGLQAGFKVAGSDLLSVQFEGVNELIARMELLPGEVKQGLLNRVIRKSGNIYLEEMRKTVPRGASRGGRDKQSASYKAAHPLRKDLHDSLTQRTSRSWRSKREAARMGIIGTAVGPEWPHGAHAHLAEFDHAHVAWGRPSGTIRGTHWMRRAKAAAAPRIQAQHQTDIPKAVERAVKKLHTTVTAAQGRKAVKAIGGPGVLGARDIKRAIKAFN